MTKKKVKKELPIIALNERQSEEVWNDLFIKEEGIVLEFDSESKSGRIRSIEDGSVYIIAGNALPKKKINLRRGDKVLFAPFEDP